MKVEFMAVRKTSSFKLCKLHFVELRKFCSHDLQLTVDNVLCVCVCVWLCRAMHRPRCGLPDRKAVEMDDGARKKRYALTGQQWDKDHITYRFIALKYENKTTIKQNIERSNSNMLSLLAPV